MSQSQTIQSVDLDKAIFIGTSALRTRCECCERPARQDSLVLANEGPPLHAKTVLVCRKCFKRYRSTFSAIEVIKPKGH